MPNFLWEYISKMFVRCENVCSNVWKCMLKCVKIPRKVWKCMFKCVKMSKVWKHLVEVSSWRCEIHLKLTLRFELEIWPWLLTLTFDLELDRYFAGTIRLLVYTTSITLQFIPYFFNPLRIVSRSRPSETMRSWWLSPT